MFSRRSAVVAAANASRRAQETPPPTQLERALAEEIRRLEDHRPDAAELARLAIACKNLGSLEHGKALQRVAMAAGLHSHPLLVDLLVEMFLRCGSLGDATQAFDSMRERGIAAWSRMITANARRGDCARAFLLFQSALLDGVLPNPIALVAALNASVAHHHVGIVRACARDLGCERHKIVATALLNAYAKCGDLARARRIFDSRMEERDLVAWTALIAGYAQHARGGDALHLYRAMLLDGVAPSKITFLSLLGACTKLGSLREARTVHDHIRESGSEIAALSIQNGVVCMYDRCGSVRDAKRVFDAMPRRDVISWTSMIAALARRESVAADAIALYRRMALEGERANKVTFLAAMEASARSSSSSSSSSSSLEEEIHRAVAESGLDSDLVVATALVTMYGREPTTLPRAQEIFDRIQQRDKVVWNALLAAYAQHGRRDKVLDLFDCMQRERIELDKPAFVAVLTSITGSSSLALGRSIHAAIAAKGFEADTIVRNALINMYGKCGCVAAARELFDADPSLQNLISWNTVIAVHAQNGEFRQSVAMFYRMLLAGAGADRATLLTVLYACTDPTFLRTGKLARDIAIQCGYRLEVRFQTALLLMHAKCGTPEAAVQEFERIENRDTASWNAMVAAFGYHGNCDQARKTFETIPEKNLASWNAIVAACGLNGQWRESFRMLQEMLVDGTAPDAVTFVTVLSSCAAGNAVAKGRSVHKFAAENGFMADVAVGNGVVDFYAKCGCLSEARLVLETMPKLDEVTWNALLAGYAQHGHGLETLELFKAMQLRGYSATRVTFMSVLHACSHVGLVAEGCQYFSSMVGDYGFMPIEEHCGCLIDLLGRAGHLSEAKMLLTRMPFKPSMISWMSILGSCKLHGDPELGKNAARKVLEFDSGNAAAHKLLQAVF